MNDNDEIPSDEALVTQLLQCQAPHWADLPVRRLPASGTDNTLYRLGENLVVRLPRRQSAVPLLAKEVTWLPEFAGLPLEVPRVCFAGRAAPRFPYGFAVLDWLEGAVATQHPVDDTANAARDMARFLLALQSKCTEGAPVAGTANHHRGVALETLSVHTVAAIDSLADEIDASAALELWREACGMSFHGTPVWLHGDLKADNLIVRGGRLSAVIDWGLCAVGDPVADVAVAWTWLESESRNMFRGEMELDDGDWLRAQGWALYGAVIALSYYRGGKNEALSRLCRRTLSQLDLLK